MPIAIASKMPKALKAKYGAISHPGAQSAAHNSKNPVPRLAFSLQKLNALNPTR
jgi:hypothetical protein